MSDNTSRQPFSVFSLISLTCSTLQPVVANRTRLLTAHGIPANTRVVKRLLEQQIKGGLGNLFIGSRNGGLIKNEKPANLPQATSPPHARLCQARATVQTSPRVSSPCIILWASSPPIPPEMPRKQDSSLALFQYSVVIGHFKRDHLGSKLGLQNHQALSARGLVAIMC